MYSTDCELVDSQIRKLTPEIFYSWNALFFVYTLCTCNSYKQDGHAAAMPSAQGTNTTKLALQERRRLCCKEASLPDNYEGMEMIVQQCDKPCISL